MARTTFLPSLSVPNSAIHTITANTKAEITRIRELYNRFLKRLQHHGSDIDLSYKSRVAKHAIPLSYRTNPRGYIIRLYGVESLSYAPKGNDLEIIWNKNEGLGIAIKDFWPQSPPLHIIDNNNILLQTINGTNGYKAPWGKTIKKP